MPITCSRRLQCLSQSEFGELSFSVMRDVFALHNEMGRFFDEVIYKRALAARRPDVELEVPVTVTHESFLKSYYLDVVVADGGLFEFKAVEAFVPRHRAQLLHYLMLCDLRHGLLVNLRPELVDREFVNAAITRDERFRYTSASACWDERLPGAEQFRSLLLTLVQDWGTCLELALYEEALTHLLGGESLVVRPVPVRLGGSHLGDQLFHHASERILFKLTAFEDARAMTQFADQARRLLAHLDRDALLWANLSHHHLTFTALP